MRGRIFFVRFALAGMLFLLLSSPTCEQKLPESIEVLQATCDLDSDDYVVVRRALQVIDRNTDKSLVLKAVDPMIGLLEDSNGRRDVYTRCLGVPVLMRIGARYPKPRKGRKAQEEIIYLLRSSPSDMVRAACARSLGVTGQTQAIPDLEQALQDSSFQVQQEACNALLRLTYGAYQSESCGQQEMMEKAKSSSNWISSFPSSSGKEVDNRDIPEAAIQWYKEHVLLPLPDGFQEK